MSKILTIYKFNNCHQITVSLKQGQLQISKFCRKQRMLEPMQHDQLEPILYDDSILNKIFMTLNKNAQQIIFDLGGWHQFDEKVDIDMTSKERNVRFLIGEGTMSFLKYKDQRGIYYGETVDDNVLHGRGITVWFRPKTQTSLIWETWFNMGVPVVGRFIESAGTKKKWQTYFGGFNDQFEFHGSCINNWNDGVTFEGKYKDNHWHGYGKMYDNVKNITMFEGQFKEGKQISGTKHISGEGIYDGEYKENCRHGKGKLTYFDGSSWEGTWNNAQKTGKGTYTYADGRYVVGKWKGEERVGVHFVYNKDGSEMEREQYEEE
ncbi:hypothetical protein FGO68_gene5573 [Halteria grandinella]|uniref:MORN repeat protein n=1 Tax=Halteria grandinella TaxID=5974 RepID=A0A8J8T0N1_HALGN|nr:hypothetical protein FGO68_gene5573 [Halteria grandinella]